MNFQGFKYKAMKGCLRRRASESRPHGIQDKLDFLFRTETRNLYWNQILSDKMGDSRGDYVFFEREKDEFTEKNPTFSFFFFFFSFSCFASFFGQITK